MCAGEDLSGSVNDIYHLAQGIEHCPALSLDWWDESVTKEELLRMFLRCPSLGNMTE